MFKSRHSQRSNSSTKSSDIEPTDDSKHWSNNIQETSLSFPNDIPNGYILIGGGAEFGELCWVKRIKNDGCLAFHSIEKFSVGDIILEVENQSVVGFTSYDLLTWLRIIAKDGNIICVKFVSPAYLTKDLRKFLNTRFQRHSLDHQLQHSIRLNVYKRTVPCTTRGMRESEIDGVDYKFLTMEEFQLLESTGGLLESGSYSGNFYGTPLPPRQEDVQSSEHQQTSSLDSRSGKNLHHHPKSVIDAVQTTNGELSIRTASLKLLDGSADDSKGDEDDGDLPPGWERVDSYPEYGVFYVDHINKRTQFERPQSRRSIQKIKTWSRDNLNGEFITTHLVKGNKGFGFTIIGGDESSVLLQIKSIIFGGAASLDQKLQRGDILVNVNGQEVLGFSYKEIFDIFQAIEVGSSVPITVCRGYPLVFDPDDPSNKIITTVAVRPHQTQSFHPFSGHGDATNLSPLKKLSDTNNATISSEGNQMPSGIESIKINLVRGLDGFRFTLRDLSGSQGSFNGQRVRSILDKSRCSNLKEGDVIEKINNITVSRMTHNQVVEILKACPIGKETEFVVLRGVPPQARSSSVTPSMERSPQISFDSDNYVYSKVLKPKWKNSSSRCILSPESISWEKHPTNIVNDPQHFHQGLGRSKTPGPILMKSHNVGEEAENYRDSRHRDDDCMFLPKSGFHSRSKSSSRPSSKNEDHRNAIGVVPDFVPAHHFTSARYSEDSNDFSTGLPFNTRVPGSAYSSSSSTSATPVQIDNFGGKSVSGLGDYQMFPVRLFRQAEGFGIKFGGGTEGGSPAVIITQVVPGGASDLDGRVKVGDEVVSINFTPVLSCRKAKEVLAMASAQGVVNLELRRLIRKDLHSPLDRNLSFQQVPPRLTPPSQTYVQTRFQRDSPLISSEVREVTLIKSDQQSFGFTIISSTAKSGSRICSIVPDGPAGRCGQLQMDDLLLAINGVDVRSMEHESIVDLIRSSGSAVTLLVTSPHPDGNSASVADIIDDNQNFHGFQSYSSYRPELVQNSERLSFKQNEENKISFDPSSFDGFGEKYRQIPDSNNSKLPSTFHYLEIKKGIKGFGFTISGGREYGEVPLSVLKIAGDGQAARDGCLKVGDEIIEINGRNTSGMTNSEAIKAIVQSDSSKVELLIKRHSRDDLSCS